MNIREFTPGVEIHQELNPLLWQGDQLKPEVRLALLHIAHKFEIFLGIDIVVRDRIITGSQTSFTYTEASDIDLHIIVDYSAITDCAVPVHELFDTKRKLWKEQHSIDIHGIQVECYVEDTAQPVRGHVYSLDEDAWVSHQPTQASVQSLPPDVVKQAAWWTDRIKTAIASRNLAVMISTARLLRDYRGRGLGKEGEMGTANITYKTLRNNGVIHDLIKAVRRLEDRAMSL
jgi:hypothetical protein